VGAEGVCPVLRLASLAVGQMRRMWVWGQVEGEGQGQVQVQVRWVDPAALHQIHCVKPGWCCPPWMSCALDWRACLASPPYGPWRVCVLVCLVCMPKSHQGRRADGRMFAAGLELMLAV
jgi:hypothetical protein